MSSVPRACFTALPLSTLRRDAFVVFVGRPCVAERVLQSTRGILSRIVCAAAPGGVITDVGKTVDHIVSLVGWGTDPHEGDYW